MYTEQAIASPGEAPSTFVTADPGPTWVSARAAIAATGMGRARINALALVGRVRSRVLAGSYPQFCLEDVLHVAKTDPSPAGHRRLVVRAGR